MPSTAHRLSLNNYPLAIQAACQGEGIALGWSYLVDEELASHRLVRPLSNALSTEYGYFILTRPGNMERTEVQSFRDWALRHSPLSREQ
ncbi:MAG: hypothetical protein BRD57_02790 [Proteobacteria bacterium SW_6_67_9]|nr:MAG: hypothetical protein BRD57_02790 [Proteobacteria bacterium SW_6_67_9]